MPSEAGLAEAAATPMFGGVVLIPFPFTDQAGVKQRPAVIVSSRAYAAERPDVVLMAITSQLRPSPAFGEVWLADWQAAGLLKPSAVKPIFATLEQRLIRRRLGTLSSADSAALAEALMHILSLQPTT